MCFIGLCFVVFIFIQIKFKKLISDVSFLFQRTTMRSVSSYLKPMWSKCMWMETLALLSCTKKSLPLPSRSRTARTCRFTNSTDARIATRIYSHVRFTLFYHFLWTILNMLVTKKNAVLSMSKMSIFYTKTFFLNINARKLYERVVL